MVCVVQTAGYGPYGAVDVSIGITPDAKNSDRDLETLASIPMEHTCSTCCDEPYSYAALGRLGSAKSKCVLSVKMEKILMRNDQLAREPFDARQTIADGRRKTFWQDFIPSGKCLAVRGDGNCLFNALSVALYGHEARSTEIRVRTIIEMEENRAAYLHTPANCRLHLVSPWCPKVC
ncbi:uncharacterized protein LOC117108358 [Anneissia japonica]|uniref:uncharacterized protein LOC117108358 n=1 Tax=Anneissia japonica TaxID=1529436 RepID=UPI0014256F91|nr:uncharacterized protein LOC117108358 [Anneissia japonica]